MDPTQITSVLPTPEIYGIGAVAVAGGWLIWKIVLFYAQRDGENTKQLIELNTRTLETLTAVKNSVEANTLSIQANTKMVQSTQETISDTQDKMTKMMLKILKNGSNRKK